VHERVNDERERGGKRGRDSGGSEREKGVEESASDSVALSLFCRSIVLRLINKEKRKIERETKRQTAPPNVCTLGVVMRGIMS
jgi:hypothetical protein